MFLWVLAFVLIGQAWSIDTGLYLDDHAHFQHLQRGDWSLRSAVEASRLGIIGQVIDLWGRREAGLLFFRPIAFWTMKAEYTLAGWNPTTMHAFVIGWHLACSLLVGGLAMRCFGRRDWATVAACLHAIHPGHTATVYWIACQTELLTSFLLLVGVLAYARYAGWPRGAFTAHLDPPQSEMPGIKPPRAVTLSVFVAIVCYGLALGCRENAVLFPLVCWLGDRLFGTTRKRRIRWEHVAMGVVLAVYLALRWHMLGGFPLPSRPYLMPITDPEFPRYMLDKAAIYLTGLFLFIPVVPIGGQVFFTRHPQYLYGLAGAVVAMIAIVWLAYRCRRELLWPLAWISCFLAPTMPVFASSHHLYLPGVGAALFMAAGLAALVLRPQGRRAAFPLRWACSATIVALAAALTAVTLAQAFSYNRGTMVEDLVIEDVGRSHRPLADGDHLFFINMPMVAYYAVPALESKLGLHDLHGHALTFTPDLLGMTTPGEIEVLDEYRFRLLCGPGHSYFEGITGNMLLDIMKLRGQMQVGRTIEAGEFTVTPTQIDERGVRELVFAFKRPLNSPDYLFFYGSPQFMAYPLNLGSPRVPATSESQTHMPAITHPAKPQARGQASSQSM